MAYLKVIIIVTYYCFEDYVTKVVAGEMFDATLSVQLRRGFQVKGIIQNYVDDASCDNKAALIVWENPDYRA